MIKGALEANISAIVETLSGEINVIDKKFISNIEDQIINIIEDDKKLEIPVFSYINRDAISKIAYFIAGAIKRPIAIGVAGETASGKSTFTKDCLDQIYFYQNAKNFNNLIARVNIDDYYYDRSDMVNELGGFENFCKNYDLDVPDAFELDLLKAHIEQLVLGNDVMLPKYDMSGTAKRYDNHLLMPSANLIVTEGLFTLTNRIKSVFDISVYVDVSTEIQRNRFHLRAIERGLGESASAVLNNAVEKAKVHIRPTKNNADIIINGEADRNRYIEIANKFIKLVDEVNADNFATV